MPSMKRPVLLKTLPVTNVNRVEILTPLSPSTGSFPSFERPNPCVALVDVLSAVNDGDSLLCQQLAPLITSVDSCC